MNRAAVALVLPLVVGCGSAIQPSNAPCESGCTSAVLGFDHGTVGHNRLALAVIRHPSELPPPDAAVAISASFAPEPAPVSFTPVTGTVSRASLARIIGTGTDQVRFDYLVDVFLDRPGTWSHNRGTLGTRFACKLRRENYCGMGRRRAERVVR